MSSNPNTKRKGNVQNEKILSNDISHNRLTNQIHKEILQINRPSLELPISKSVSKSTNPPLAHAHRPRLIEQ
jgi:hypothetical protein